MSVHVDDNIKGASINDQSKDSYGLPVQQNSPRDLGGKVTYDSHQGKSYGVRIPVLRDLDDKYQGRKKPTACRFDIVEKVTTVIKPGSYGPDDNRSRSNSEEGNFKRISLSRQPTFHSTTSMPARSQKDSSVLDKIGEYHWNSWTSHNKGDARDVLYKNTYSTGPKHVRYRTLTLPRISTAPGSGERPWTVAGDEKPVVARHENGEYSKVVTIVPQQPRGTVVRFHEIMKPVMYNQSAQAFEVKRCSSRVLPNNHRYAAMSSDGLPLIRQDFRKSPRRTERPLKSENVNYTRKSNKETLFNKYMMPAYRNALNRDYSSADTFKEYLDSLQQGGKGNAAPNKHSAGEMTGYRNFEMKHTTDYHNRVLQSVSDVNKPGIDANNDYGMERAISVEIKQTRRDSRPNTKENSQPEFPLVKQSSIENLSSVHGSVVRAHSDTHSVTLPRSSSVAESKTVVKIPSVVSESGKESIKSVKGGSERNNSITSVVSNKEALPETKLDTVGEENGSLCPANTPTPMV